MRKRIEWDNATKRFSSFAFCKTRIACVCNNSERAQRRPLTYISLLWIKNLFARRRRPILVDTRHFGRINCQRFLGQQLFVVLRLFQRHALIDRQLLVCKDFRAFDVHRCRRVQRTSRRRRDRAAMRASCDGARRQHTSSQHVAVCCLINV